MFDTEIKLFCLPEKELQFIENLRIKFLASFKHQTA